MQTQSAIFLLMLCLSFDGEAVEALTEEQQLGKLLFEDKNLSLNRNQSCASCHSLSPVLEQNLVPGFVDPENLEKGTPVSLGSIPGATGVLNAPSAGYAAFSPMFHLDDEGLYVGGQFWNGRASNLTEQAKGPFLNPVEMAMPSQWSVVSRLKENEEYKKLFWQIYGLDLALVPHLDNTQINSTTPAGVTEIYHHLAKAISAFERSPVFNKFNSKFDYFLAGMAELTEIETKGLELFNGQAKCSACHVSETASDELGNAVPPMFTDFTYDNIGLPRNVKIPNNPEPNTGLGGREDIKALDPNGDEIGKHKVMSLRNIALTAPYGHNGVFATLEQIVHFYNTRDTLGRVNDNQDPGFAISGWPAPEIQQNVNTDELGDLALTADDEEAIVAFMKTLTDDYPLWGNDQRVPPGTASPFPGVKPFSENEHPQANAGVNQTIRLGSRVTLDGRASNDPDNAPSPLTYLWTKVSGPDVTLTGDVTSTPNFVPALPGSYLFNLVVNDSANDSDPASVTITAPKLGDIDLDGDVDSNDLNRVTSTLNKPASGPNDLRDINGDMKLDALDARKLVLLCTKPRCAI